MIAWLAELPNIVAGDNLAVIHIVPVLAMGALVFVTCLTARELGGGRFAQALAEAGARGGRKRGHASRPYRRTRCMVL